MKLLILPSHFCRRFKSSTVSKARFHGSTSDSWRRPKQTVKARGARERFVKFEEKMEEKTDYSAWSHKSLIERVSQLEAELKSNNQGTLIPTIYPEKKSWKKPRTERVFDPSKYNTRLVAFKLAYLGKRYNGFEHHLGHGKPLPTIEEELWKAFNKARLIFPKGAHPLQPGEVNWEGTDYSKCGRTDKGVSAFGQVIGIRVRSNRPMVKRKVSEKTQRDYEIEDGAVDMFNSYPRKDAIEIGSAPLNPSRINQKDNEAEYLSISDPDFAEALNFDPVADELPYCSLLNRLLPPDIRILAWCPAPPTDFSARFSCRERRYKYFFTNPAFTPMPHNLDGYDRQTPKDSPQKMKDGYLDIEAMQKAAKLFEGDHDFRNFCKVDPGKQMVNFERRIFHTEIKEELDGSPKLAYLNDESFIPGEPSNYPQVWSFNLYGSAFLWHQVRCMVSILFLVGQGLEKPSIVSELLDVTKNPQKPIYEMASDTPLVLWDCIFPHENDPGRGDALQWVYVGDGPGKGDDKYGSMGLIEGIWGVWRERKIDETLAANLFQVVQLQGMDVPDLTKPKRPIRSQRVFDGGNLPDLQGVYQPVMEKPLMELVEVVNERYAMRKGFQNSADMKKQGFRRMNKPVEEDKVKVAENVREISFNV